MPTRRPADAENPPLTDGFGRSIFPEILSARNTGSLAIWFRHHCFAERGARELPLSPHSGNHRQLTTPHGRMQALCKTHVKLPPGTAPPPNSSVSPNRPSTRISRSGWRRSTPRSISRCGSCSTATRPSGTSAAAWRRGENTKVHNPDRGTSFRKNRGYYRRR